MKLLIAISTRGRTHRQRTYREIQTFGQRYNDCVRLFCCKEEAPHLPNAIVCPENDGKVGALSRTRQWIMDNTKAEYVLHLDDDLYFYRRNDQNKLRKLEPFEFDDLIDEQLRWLEEGYAHTGLSFRGGNNRVPEASKEVARVHCFYGFNVECIRSHDIRFDKYPIMQDIHVTLSLLELGYPNILSYQFCYNQESQDTGGCSIYRTAELMEQVSKQLEAEHTHVTAVQKTGWKGIENRWDVNVKWQKSLGINLS